MKKYNILVVKESRAGEGRVSLLPNQVTELVKVGHSVFIEAGAGDGVSVEDGAYVEAGAIIRKINIGKDVKVLFKDINLIVRVKRANKEREIQELSQIEKDTIMIGALDPKEPNSDHIKRYKDHDIICYSIDYLNVSETSTLNILAAMSKITGSLALQDAINKFSGTPAKAVIIGYGSAGKSALNEAISQNLDTTVFCTQNTHKKVIQASGANAIIIDKEASIEKTQQKVLEEVINADIIITAARSANKRSPLMIPIKTQKKMMPGSIIVDLALSDGGNVEGAKHDETLTTENGIIIMNVSGYPKIVPNEASIKWSQASKAFIDALSSGGVLVESARLS